MTDCVETIGLIAGNGTFPLSFAREAAARGYRVVAVAHRDETDRELEALAADVTWIRVGQVSAMVRAFRAAGVVRAVMCGGIDKPRSLGALRPDLRALRLLGRARGKGDDALLVELAAEFEREGISIVPSTLFLENLLASPGAIAGREPSAAERADIAVGRRVLGALGGLDVGQSVVVERGVVLAVEAIEGTDEAIARAGALGSGGGVLVKASKSEQDMRFDVAAVGPQTVRSLAAAGLACMALEAGRTLVLDRDEVVAAADAAGIAVFGYAGDDDD